MAVKMVDRLAELRTSRRYSHLRDGYEDEVAMEELGHNFATEYSNQVEDIENPPLQGFFAVVNELRRCIADISFRNEEIKQVQRNILNKPPGMHQKDKEKHIQLIEEVKRYSQRVQQGLKRMEEEIKTEETSFDSSIVEFRIKKSQFHSLAYQVKQVMTEFRRLEEDHKERSRAIIRRQMQAIDPDSSFSDDQMEDALERDFNIATKTDHHRAILDDVEARKNEILELEHNVQELNGMFLDMMILIDEQGEMINQIEHNVSTASDYVSKGEKGMTKAVVYKHQNRRIRVLICLIICMVVVVIFVVVLLLINHLACRAYRDECF